MSSKKVSESFTSMSILMNPVHSNIFGNVHGGHILKFSDEVAYVSASKHANSHCVTASVDRVDFYKPINIGDLVTFTASVNLVGNTSMEVGVKVIAENHISGKKLHTNTCYFTMVAIDEKGKPRKVASLELENEEQKKRNREAIKRRDNRLGERKKENS